MGRTIPNPIVPHCGPLAAGDFGPDQVVRIVGFVPGAALRFDVSLQCGPSTTPRSDTALKVSVKFYEQCIVVNSLRNGVWAQDQRCSLSIYHNRSFEIALLCTSTHYKVYINNQQLCEIPQRIPYNHITHLLIDGDVSLQQISYETAARSSTVPIEDEPNGFEMIDNSQKPPGVLPSYQDAVRAPYPVSDPQGMPAPFSAGGVQPPYPINLATMPFPEPSDHEPVVVSQATPLVTPNRPAVEKRSDSKTWQAVAAFVLGFIVIVGIIVAKVIVSNNRSPSSSSFE